jgi:hypothetical protein
MVCIFVMLAAFCGEQDGGRMARGVACRYPAQTSDRGVSYQGS